MDHIFIVFFSLDILRSKLILLLIPLFVICLISGTIFPAYALDGSVTWDKLCSEHFTVKVVVPNSANPPSDITIRILNDGFFVDSDLKQYPQSDFKRTFKIGDFGLIGKHELTVVLEQTFGGLSSVDALFIMEKELEQSVPIFNNKIAYSDCDPKIFTPPEKPKCNSNEVRMSDGTCKFYEEPKQDPEIPRNESNSNEPEIDFYSILLVGIIISGIITAVGVYRYFFRSKNETIPTSEHPDNNKEIKSEIDPDLIFLTQTNIVDPDLRCDQCNGFVETRKRFHNNSGLYYWVFYHEKGHVIHIGCKDKFEEKIKSSKFAGEKPDDPVNDGRDWWQKLHIGDKENILVKYQLDLILAKQNFDDLEHGIRLRITNEFKTVQLEKANRAKQQAEQEKRDAEIGKERAERERDSAQRETDREKREKKRLELEQEKSKETINQLKRDLREQERRAAEDTGQTMGAPYSGVDPQEFLKISELNKIATNAYGNFGRHLSSEGGIEAEIGTKTRIVGKITEKESPRPVNTKYGIRRVCNSTLEDPTGKISLTLWEDDISQFSIGDEIEVRNGWLKWYGVPKLSKGTGQLVHKTLAKKYEEKRREREKFDFLNYKTSSLYKPETSNCHDSGRFTDDKLDKLIQQFRNSGYNTTDKKFRTQTIILEQIIRAELYYRLIDESLDEDPYEDQYEDEPEEAFSHGTGPYAEYYEILGVSENATTSEIKNAWRAKIIEWHPDKNPPERKELCEEMIRKINEAAETLGIKKSKT